MKSRSTTPIDKAIGQKIRIFRKAKGLTQTELGAAIGVRFQQVQKYENGMNRVGSGRLLEIAKILEIPISRFYDDQTKWVYGGEMLTDLLSGPHAVQMLQVFSKIKSADLRRKIVKLTESIANTLKR